MIRLLIAIVVGLVLAVGATMVTVNALSGVANGSPTNGTLYQYGDR
jgi:hypothetical protein